MEWVLWFAAVGTEQATLVTEFKTEKECQEAAEKLRRINGVIFDCWEREKKQSPRKEL